MHADVFVVFSSDHSCTLLRKILSLLHIIFVYCLVKHDLIGNPLLRFPPWAFHDLEYPYGGEVLLQIACHIGSVL